MVFRGYVARRKLELYCRIRHFALVLYRFRRVDGASVSEMDHSSSHRHRNVQYMTGVKQYKRYVADLLESSPMHSMDMKDFKGGMGHGQINAYALLKAVEGAGVEMTFPNLYVAVGGQTTVSPSMYMEGNAFTVSVADSSVATAEVVNGMVVVKGLKAGQTIASITGSRTDKFVITVRENANGNGWL